MATLAALADGDALSFARVQSITTLTPGNLLTHLRKLEDAGYIDVVKFGFGSASRTTIALSSLGRESLESYKRTLGELLDGL